MFNENFANVIQTNDINTIVDMLDNSELSNIDVNDDDHTYIYNDLKTDLYHLKSFRI